VRKTSFARSRKNCGAKVHYKLTVDAKDDLKRIYRRGFEDFGEARADQYFADMFERFEVLAREPLLYPVADTVDDSLRKSLCGVDVIYYEVVDDGVLIIRILGRQNLDTSFNQ